MKREHEWNVTFKEARAIQERLRPRVKLLPLTKKIRTVAGVDISHNRFSKELYAGVVVLSYPELEILDEATAHFTTKFPYVPGFLSFREIPALLKALKKLKVKPDLLLVDGHGIAHPRRLGIATHLSLVTGIPSIGCGKSRLFGVGSEPDEEPGSVSELADPKTGEVIGLYLRTKRSAKPMIISAGNKITLTDALLIALSCLRGYRMPEPTRRAHILVNAARRRG